MKKHDKTPAAPPVPFFFALLALVLLPRIAGAQEEIFGVSPEIAELMRAGIEYHDKGEFGKAIECYEKALNIDPDNPGIYYELAFSHLYSENPQAALDNAQKGIDYARGQGLTGELAGLYDLKGSALDDLGRHEEAVQVYLEAISRFENVNRTRLYYNLGLTYYRMGERDKAWEALAKSLMADTFHPSSNFLLGKICYEQGRRTQSLYSLCYFLLLEPNTERSSEAYETIMQLIIGDGGEEEIYVANTGNFTGTDLLLGLMLTSQPAMPDENDGALFRRRLSVFFSLVEEQAGILNSSDKIITSADDLWWKFYIPFFSKLAKSDHFEAFCHYITMAGSSGSTDWINANGEKLDAMFEWLNDE